MNPALNLSFELTASQRRLLIELLEHEQSELPHEIHHTAKMEMRRELEQRLEMVETVLKKLETP
jgi:hypothetical protein